MAIDSKSKRQSIAAIGLYSIGPSVVPDGTFSLFQRQVIGYGYGGVPLPSTSEATISIAFSGSISEQATVVYIGNLTVDVTPGINQSSSLISDVESVISIPLYCSLSTGAVFITNQSYSQGVIQSVSDFSNAEFISAYNQNVVSSIVQSAVKEIDGEAYITVGVNLSDEYSVLATLSDGVTFNVIKSITSTVGNVLNATYTEGVVSSLSLVGEVSIEGLLGLNVGLSVTETVAAVIESNLDVGISLDDLYSVTGISFVEYLSDVVLSDGYISGQELFTSANLDVVIEITSSEITTDFVMITPSKRILISLGSNRIIASLATDRSALIVK